MNISIILIFIASIVFATILAFVISIILMVVVVIIERKIKSTKRL